MPRPTVKQKRLPWYCPDDPFFLSLNLDGTRAALIDIFANAGSATGLTMRLGVHETNLGASMTQDFDVSPADLRQLAQFIFRKLRTEVPSPQAAPHRYYPERTFNDKDHTDYARRRS